MRYTHSHIQALESDRAQPPLPLTRFVPRAGWAAVLAGAAWLAPTAALAQPAPLVTPRDLRPETPTSPATPVPRAAPTPAPAAAAAIFATVRDVRVAGGYPELEARTATLVAPLAGQRLAASEFYKVAEAIESLYHDAGYPLVRVVVPPQTVRDGSTLQLNVIDGFIENVDVAAVPPRARALVQRQLAAIEGQRHLTGAQLERALTIAGRAPGVSLRSTLAQGTTTGGVILVIEAEFDPAGGSVSFDNRLSKALGPWQATVQVRENQLLGLGEQTYLYVSGGPPVSRAFRSDAPRRVAGGGVILPVGNDGLTFNPELTWSDTLNPAVGTTPLTESAFQRFTLRIGYPVRLTRAEELNVSVALEATDQKTTAPDFDVVLNHDRLRVLRLGADWSAAAPLNPQGRLRLSTTLSQGFVGLGARTAGDATSSGVALSRPGARPDFFKAEAGVVLDQPLPFGWQSRTMFRGQRASGVLPSAELFSLDGEDALSTFRSGTLSDDNGWVLRQEFARPVNVTLPAGDVALLPYVFGAVGRLSTNSAAVVASPRGTSAAYGVGLRGAWRVVNLSMEYGRRHSHPDDLDGSQIFLKGQVQF